MTKDENRNCDRGVEDPAHTLVPKNEFVWVNQLSYKKKTRKRRMK